MNEQTRGLVTTTEIYDEAALLYQRFGEVENLKKIQAQLVEDLEKSLNLLVAYQRCLRILRSPDPNYVEARKLLSKYQMVGVEPAEQFKIYADGVDITLHPDSIESTATIDTYDHSIEGESVTVGIGMLDLPEDKEWENDQGIESAEMVSDGEGNMRLKPIGNTNE